MYNSYSCFPTCYIYCDSLNLLAVYWTYSAKLTITSSYIQIWILILLHLPLPCHLLICRSWCPTNWFYSNEPGIYMSMILGVHNFTDHQLCWLKDHLCAPILMRGQFLFRDGKNKYQKTCNSSYSEPWPIITNVFAKRFFKKYMPLKTVGFEPFFRNCNH